MIADIANKVLTGDEEALVKLIEEALQSGIEPETIISDGLIAAMDEAGAGMRSGDMYVPEVLMAAEAMKAGLAILQPLVAGDIKSKGKVLIGTVSGDLHDIGKNLVIMMLESSGYEIIDLGVDVGVDSFLQASNEHKPDIVGVSALLTTTMPYMEQTVKALKENAPQSRVIVGGAPVNEQFAGKIGADGYAPDAAAAVDLCRSLL